MEASDEVHASSALTPTKKFDIQRTGSREMPQKQSGKFGKLEVR
jgi:hypothetical protein